MVGCGNSTTRNIPSLLYCFLTYVAFGLNQNSEALQHYALQSFINVFKIVVLVVSCSKAANALVKAFSTKAILPDILGILGIN